MKIITYWFPCENWYHPSITSSAHMSCYALFYPLIRAFANIVMSNWTNNTYTTHVILCPFCTLSSRVCSVLWCGCCACCLIIKLYVFCTLMMMIIDFQLTCAQATAEPTVLKTAGNENITTLETASTEEAISLIASTLCTQFPSYYSNYSVLILIATTVITQLSHVCKICLMAIIAGMLLVLILECFWSIGVVQCGRLQVQHNMPI